MRKNYDFSKAKKNPYAKNFKKSVNIRLDEEVIGYFKKLAQENGMPYQTLINLYLKECTLEKKSLEMKWKKPA
jgi:predicted DNA binding CopG/RHH family protein